GPATVEAEHQPGPLGRAAMVERIDAERPVGADQPRLDALEMREARPPDQRAIGEHPEVGGISRQVHVRFILTIHRKQRRENNSLVEIDFLGTTPRTTSALMLLRLFSHGYPKCRLAGFARSNHGYLDVFSREIFLPSLGSFDLRSCAADLTVRNLHC